MIFVRTYTTLAVTILVILSAAFFLLPEIREQLYEEDQFVENITVMIYLSVVLCAVGGFFYVKGKYDKSVMLLFLALGLLTLLEELSYGERYFGFIAPRILDYKMDTVHDFFFLFFKAVKELAEHFGLAVFFLFAALGGLLLYLLYRIRDHILPLITSLVRQPPFFYISIFIGLGLTALLVDLRIFKYDLLQVLEEGLEMDAALALAFGCIAAFRYQTGR
ncbi:MAG: hypothetical protein ACR2P1_08615 [Pseudomonadales bacterium]